MSKLRQSAKEQLVCCPFHEEKTPSCVIYEDGRFQCLGCGAEGTYNKDGEPIRKQEGMCGV